MAAFSTTPDWSFPEEIPGGWNAGCGQATASDAKSSEPQQPAPKGPPRAKRRHYGPRQCRICLEEVQPTFHFSENTALPSVLQSEPRVTYESTDGGRLLSPCKCKGSQRYVHEECLNQWRRVDPTQKRNYWQCPTCSYKYNLSRLNWSTWVSSGFSQVGLTLAIFLVCVFVFGFVADPIINLYLDPVSTITTAGGPSGSLIFEDEPATWTEHFVKGLASLGLLGFAKFLLTLSPFQWFNIRTGGMMGSRAGTTGRDRLAQISWISVTIGIVTFLWAVWKGVRAWSRRTLEKAGERVLDVPGAADDYDDDDDN